MGQSGWRLPDDLLRRVRVRCAETGVRQNVFVVRALESALIRETEPARAAPVPGVSSEQSVSSRASASSQEPVPAVIRPGTPSARTKKAKGPASGSIPVIAPRHWGQ
jgi:hypothetical protein